MLNKIIVFVLAGALVASWRTTPILAVEHWNGWNGMRVIVGMAIERGVPAETIVLLLLLPVVATMVGIIHYLVGFTGYGIFMPTMVAVVLTATGIPSGLLLFGLILMISSGGNMLLKRLKLHFWPSRSINLVMIGLGTFGLMLLGTVTPWIDLSKISIFPVLFMVMLAEEFVRTQLIKSRKEAVKLTLGTLILAVVGAVIMDVGWIREAVLLNPEIVLVVVAVNLLVGNYSGIRLTEIARFKKAIRKK
ncbi:MAG: 7TM domain-containing protein [Candidatus Shapirobacteria bacterium]|jgi:hypothetical protein